MHIFLYILIYFNLTFSMTGLELAQKMKDIPKPIDNQSKSSMLLTNKKGKEKNLKLISKSKDDSKKQMIWFIEPKDDYGISFLKIEKDDLSFEDMTSRDIDDYKYKIVSEDTPCFEEDKSQRCFILESIPNDKKSEYSKHLSWIDKTNYIWHKEESYDKSGNLLKNKKIKYLVIDNFYIMNELQVENVQKKHSTLLTVSDIKINLNFSDDIFHTKTIKRMPLID